MAPRKPAPPAAATAGDDAKPRARRAATRKSAPKTAPNAVKGGTKATGEGQAAKPRATKKAAPRKAAPKKTEEAKPAQMGRPSVFSQELADEICERIALGETLTEITSDEDKPSPSTVWRWQRSHDDFRKAIAHAREAQTRMWADQIVDLADDSSNDWTIRRRQNGEAEEVLNRDHIERVKMQIDARKWLMARVNRADYGDKQQIDHNHSFADLSTVELGRKVRELLAKLGLELTDEEMEFMGL